MFGTLVAIPQNAQVRVQVLQGNSHRESLAHPVAPAPGLRIDYASDSTQPKSEIYCAPESAIYTDTPTQTRTLTATPSQTATETATPTQPACSSALEKPFLVAPPHKSKVSRKKIDLDWSAWSNFKVRANAK